MPTEQEQVQDQAVQGDPGRPLLEAPAVDDVWMDGGMIRCCNRELTVGWDYSDADNTCLRCGRQWEFTMPELVQVQPKGD